MKFRPFPVAALLAAFVLAGCSVLPDKPVREVLYDFGPLAATEPLAVAAAPGTPLVLPDLEVNGALETTAMVYRLGYSDPFELRPYTLARWGALPGQLVRQRLRDQLSRVRPILDAQGAAALRRGGTVPPVLRIELEEFSQHFDSAAASRGVLRLRCTLVESTAGGERLVAQRTFDVQRPAPSADAAGGVRALAAATDAAGLEIAAWLGQQR